MELPPAHYFTERSRAGDGFLRVRRRKFGQGNNCKPANEVEGVISNQTLFSCANGDGEIGHNAILISCASVAVESARQIDRKNIGTLFAAKSIGLAAGGQDRVPQGRLGSQSQQSIENVERRRNSWSTFSCSRSAERSN